MTSVVVMIVVVVVIIIACGFLAAARSKSF
jgi:hypothetical protein